MDEDEHIKEVYAHFGLAMYLAQVLEHGIVNALIYADLVPRRAGHVRTKEQWEAEFDAFMGRHFEVTLGRLLKRLNEHVPVPEGLQANLNAALKARNHLAHVFFRERAAPYMSAEGRDGMLKELAEAQTIFERADADLDAVVRPFRMKIGFTDERLQREYEQMCREAGIDR